MENDEFDQHLVREPSPAKNPVGKVPVFDGINFSKRVRKEKEVFEEPLVANKLLTAERQGEQTLSDEDSARKESINMDQGEYYVKRMMETMEEWFSKPREGFHVSDVCLCPRQRVFREIDRVPLDAKTVNMYSTGKAIHEVIQLLFVSDKRTFEREKYVEFEDIQGSVDIYDRRRNTPLEFKTVRASDIKEPKSFHVEQLKYYMSILGAEQGYMIYQLLMHFGETPIKYFRITMNAQQRKAQLDKLVKEVNSLRRAIESEDPSRARPVNNDPSLNWMCRDCPYSAKCKDMNNAAMAA